MRIALLAALVACGTKSSVIHPPHDTLEIPIVVANVGLSASELEARVVIPLEGALATIPQVAHVRARITPGEATITVELAPGTDEFAARSAILQAAETARLPAEVSPELGRTIDHRGAILRYTLSSDAQSLVQLRTWQDWMLRRELLRTPGIADVRDATEADVEARVRDALRESHVVVLDRNDLVVQLVGPDSSQLRTIADALARELGTRTTGRLGDQRMTVKHVVPSAAALASYSVTGVDFGELLRASSEQGVRVADMFRREVRVPVVARVVGVDPLQLRVPRSDGTSLPLSALAKIETTLEDVEILRDDRQRWVGVRAAASEQVIREALGHLAIPAGIRWQLAAAE